MIVNVVWNSVVYSGVKTAMQRAPRVRFKLILPLVAVVLAAALMVISKEQRRLFHFDAPPPTTAYAIGFAFNGPAFMYVPYLDEFVPAAVQRATDYQAARLILTAIFWFAIGCSIDRRREGRDLSIESPRSAIALFSTSLVLSAWLFFLGFERLPRDIHYYRLAPYVPGELIISSSISAWGVLFLVFFGSKTLRALKGFRRG
jgi:hypothetical protein